MVQERPGGFVELWRVGGCTRVFYTTKARTHSGLLQPAAVPWYIHSQQNQQRLEDYANTDLIILFQ